MSQQLFDLSGRVALVTGASRGIGRAIAEGLASAGADLALTSRGSAELEEVAAGVRQRGRRAEVLPTDMSQVGDARAVVDATLDRLGQIDVLVNVAGTTRRKPSVEVTEDDWDAVMSVNLKSAFFVTQAVGRYWIDTQRFADGSGRGKGKVVSITSLTSLIGIRGTLAYAVSKSGLMGAMRVLALEWAPHNICVNGIAPGYIETTLTRPLFEDPTFSAWIHSRIPSGKHGQPGDVVGTAVFLSAPASDYLSGQNLVVDAGWMAS